MLISFATTETTYRFDPAGRLAQRVRSGSNFLGTAVLDTVTYTRWDASGRPVAGELTDDRGVQPVSIVYDDIERSATASNGERVVRDVHGDIVEEVEFGGAAGRLRHFSVEATAEVCVS